MDEEEREGRRETKGRGRKKERRKIRRKRIEGEEKTKIKIEDSHRKRVLKCKSQFLQVSTFTTHTTCLALKL